MAVHEGIQDGFVNQHPNGTFRERRAVDMIFTLVKLPIIVMEEQM